MQSKDALLYLMLNKIASKCYVIVYLIMSRYGIDGI